MKSVLALLPGAVIKPGNAGLLPLGGDLTGKNLVLAPERLKERMRFARNQILLDVSGFGCKPHAIGTKIFGKHLDGEEAQWRSGDFIGIASDALVELAKLDRSQEKPIDLSLKVYMAVGPGYFGKGDEMSEALKNLARSMGKKRVAFPSKGVLMFRVHPEAYIDDFCRLCAPAGTKIEEIK